MKTYKAVLFDLDGTLLDTVEDLADSMNAVLKSLNFPTHPVQSYNYFVGDGLTNLSQRVLPSTARQDRTIINNCSQLMLKEYGSRWANKSKLYPGIANLLDELQHRGLQLNILSNKPDNLTKKAVNFFLNDWSFIHIVGAKPDVPRKPDPRAALEIATNIGFSPSDFLYLGDTNTDMQTAISAKMTPVGVLWGFRPRKELAESGADILLKAPLDLLEYL